MNLHEPITKGNRSLKMYASRLEKLDIHTYYDFLMHLPNRYEDYSIISQISSIQPGETVTVQGQVLDIKTNYMRGARIRTMQKAIVTDGSGTIELTWFNQPYLTKTILPNSTISASGKADVFGKQRTLSLQSPEFEILYNENAHPIHTGRLIPVYPETQGVSSKWLRRQIHNLLTTELEQIKEYLPEQMIEKNHLLNFPQAIREIHYPKDHQSAQKARERLAFDELFLMQLHVKKRRQHWQEKQATDAFDISTYKKQIDTCIASLPFTLTQAQQNALTHIFKDISQRKPMNRLLQGDVGSGKTVVAAIAMYVAHLNGYQSVLMAPTEILANQHFKTISDLLTPLGVTVDIVTGSKKSINYLVSGISYDKKAKKQNTKYKIPDTNILIGTHAVLSEKIIFDKLGLVVIDEQQRFGVSQRGIIREKGKNPHLLTMTATPIPRTVALTMYGDLELSYLNDMPHGRKKVKTWVVPPEKRTSAYNWMREQILNEPSTSSGRNNSSLSDPPAGRESKGNKSQAFIVCPFIEPSETMQTIKAVKQEYERLSKEVFPDLKLGLLHGKQKAKEKTEMLAAFREGTYDILIATPVVEVGIDIPNATIIMIEASERFGLAQLHQLRGRVGRGDKQSYCLLFTESIHALTSQRLKGMETIYSGAELAELDLRLRGPGNLYGTAQHGVPKLKAASFSDTELIQKAKYAADTVFIELSRYPDLQQKLDNMTHDTVSPD